jgi:hypothetical protein
MRSEVAKGVLKDRPVVDLRTENNLSVKLDIIIKQCFELFRDVRP